MAGLFDLLPLEIKKCELFPWLDPASRFILHHPLHRKKFPDTFPEEVQRHIVGNGPDLMRHYWGRIDHDQICGWAAQSGRTDSLRYAYDNKCTWGRIVDSPTYQGPLLSLIKWCYRGQNSPLTCAYAALFGHLDCLKALHQLGCPWDERACMAAVSNGHLDRAEHGRAVARCLSYLHENECPWSVSTFVTAIKCNQLECLNYIQTKKTFRMYRYSEACDLYAVAASKGHLACLKFLKENAYPYGSGTATMEAAMKGHLECLIYLHQNGCPWNVWTTEYAAKYKHLDCLKYAYENGCPCDEKIVQQYQL